tara:strand:- start:136 stop:2625 length:2490 start_codon:yes stop_codon:yes gene_type:complete
MGQFDITSLYGFIFALGDRNQTGLSSTSGNEISLVYNHAGLTEGTFFAGIEGANIIFKEWTTHNSHMGQWYHLTMTYDGSTLYVYKNGENSGYATRTAPVLPDDNCVVRLFGDSVNENATHQGVQSRISNFKLYDCCLTRDEVRTLYGMGRCDEGHHVVSFEKTRVGIGLGDGCAPKADLDVRGRVRIGPSGQQWRTSGDEGDRLIQFHSGQAVSGQPTLEVTHYGGTRASPTPTVLQISNELGGGSDWSVTEPYGMLSFATADGSGSGVAGPAASVGAVCDTTSGGGDTRLAFFTNSGIDHVERMCVTHDGGVGIGTTQPNKKLHLKDGDVHLENSVIYMGSATYTGANGLLQLISGNGPNRSVDAMACKPSVNGNHIINFVNTSGSQRGEIAGNGANNVTYNTASDDRLKKQIKPMESVLERVNNLKACTYTWIRDETEGYGFIAQEVHKLFPEMKPSLPSTVFNPTCDDEYDYPRNEDGTDHYYGLDYGTFTPFLTKAIQELDAKVEERHNRKSFITDIDYSVIEDYEGLIASANTNEFKNGKPTLTLSKVEKDKRCYGIILGKTKSIDSETIVQRSGDGRMWVINTQGNLESGDLITSSAVSGYGSKQDDDLLRSCTIAKITQDCDFTQKYIPIKCVKQEMKDVTYYIQDYYVEVLHFDPYKKEDLLKRDVPMYFKPCKPSSQERGYEPVITPFMTRDDYDNLSDEEKENYTVSHVIYKTPYEYEHLNEDDKSEYTETIKTGYYLKEVRESAKPMPECCGEYTTEVRQELVNVLDEHGQIQWEDDPSGATEKAYKIRYLDASGVETDEANHVHKAAFVGCTYHCG